MPAAGGALQVVATGNASAAALMADGRVFTWGSNREGALGNGVNPSITYRPVDIGLSGITSIAAGLDRSSFVLEDSSLWEAGNSPTARFVNGSAGADLFNIVTETSFENALTAVGLAGDTAIYHRTDGTVWRNFFAASRQVENLTGVEQVVAAGSHGIARLTGGSLASFGWDAASNSSGQLGLGTDTEPATRFSATPIPGVTSVAGIATSTGHTLAFQDNGSLLAWGENASGQLGTGDTAARFSPTTISGIENVVAVSAGPGHSLAVTSSGEVYSWGSNDFGQLGLGDLTSRTAPTKINIVGQPQATAVAAGDRHSIILLSDGRILACGENSSGQLGTGSISRSTAPTPVSAIANVVEIAAGRAHSVARLANGRARAWGDNSLGQVGSGESIARSPFRVENSTSPISNGRVYSLAAADDTSWKLDFFSENQLRNDAISGDNADPDGDGYPNLFEYATGGNPLIPDSSLVTSGLEKISDNITTSSGLGVEPGQTHLFIELSFAQPDMECVTEVSDDLINWEPLAEGSANSIIVGDRLRVYDDIPVSNGTPTRFMRCRIIRTYY